MVNCNPETVSTDYDTSDRLYFEPLTAEDVVELVRVEQRSGRVMGVIVQLAARPAELAAALEAAAIPILGTSPRRHRPRRGPPALPAAAREACAPSARERHRDLRRRGRDDCRRDRLPGGHPTVLRARRARHGDRARPGRLARYMTNAVKVSGTSPVLIDRYLQDAIEVDVDALADGDVVHVAGIMEHIEEAGIHSGDSACSLRPTRCRPRSSTRSAGRPPRSRVPSASSG